MELAGSNTQAIKKIFQIINLSFDNLVQLQSSSASLNHQKWLHQYSQIQNNILRGKFLYIYLKIQDGVILAGYIGKSTTQNKNRLIQHLEGLKKYQVKKTSDYDSFYKRFYEKFFTENVKSEIFLGLFKWDGSKTIRKLFPFECDVNLANAEALIVSYLSKQYPTRIVNHEFIGRSKWVSLNIKYKNIPNEIYLNILADSVKNLWNSWCYTWFLQDLSTVITDKNKLSENINPLDYNEAFHIPLFQPDSEYMSVMTKTKPNGNKILQKHPQMIQNIINAVKVVKKSFSHYSINEHNNNLFHEESTPLFADGLIYMVYVLKKDLTGNTSNNLTSIKSSIIPLYIGKTEAVGTKGKFSGNLKGVSKGKNSQFFARWGSDSARHMGGLSFRFFNVPNKYPSTDYEHWIKLMFDSEKRRIGVPSLKYPVYFKMMPWFPYNIEFAGQIGIFSPEIETYLIALGRLLFPNILVNKQGR